MRSTHWHSRLNLDYRLKTKFKQKINRLKKKDPDLKPYTIEDKTIASNWWGKSWNAYLKNYTPKKLHLEKGKLHFRCDALAHLDINARKVTALVLGSQIQPYSVELEFSAISEAKWKKIQKLYDGHLESFEQILDHQFPKTMSDIFTDGTTGLLPTNKEITYSCDCSDRTTLCKHVAVVLYALGNKIDHDAQVLFTLRGVNVYELISKSIQTQQQKILQRIRSKKIKPLDCDNLSEMFDIEITAET